MNTIQVIVVLRGNKFLLVFWLTTIPPPAVYAYNNTDISILHIPTRLEIKEVHQASSISDALIELWTSSFFFICDNCTEYGKNATIDDTIRINCQS